MSFNPTVNSQAKGEGWNLSSTEAESSTSSTETVNPSSTKTMNSSSSEGEGWNHSSNETNDPFSSQFPFKIVYINSTKNFTNPIKWKKKIHEDICKKIGIENLPQINTIQNHFRTYNIKRCITLPSDIKEKIIEKLKENLDEKSLQGMNPYEQNEYLENFVGCICRKITELALNGPKSEFSERLTPHNIFSLIDTTRQAIKNLQIKDPLISDYITEETCNYLILGVFGNKDHWINDLCDTIKAYAMTYNIHYDETQLKATLANLIPEGEKYHFYDYKENSPSFIIHKIPFYIEIFDEKKKNELTKKKETKKKARLIIVFSQKHRGDGRYKAVYHSGEFTLDLDSIQKSLKLPSSYSCQETLQIDKNTGSDKTCSKLLEKEIKNHECFYKINPLGLATPAKILAPSYKGEKITFITQPLYESGDLFEALQRSGSSIELKNMIEIAKDVALALTTMHKYEFIHGDVKLENILLKKEKNNPFFKGFLSDLGLCQPFGEFNLGLDNDEVKQFYEKNNNFVRGIGFQICPDLLECALPEHDIFGLLSCLMHFCYMRGFKRLMQYKDITTVESIKNIVKNITLQSLNSFPSIVLEQYKEFQGKFDQFLEGLNQATFSPEEWEKLLKIAREEEIYDALCLTFIDAVRRERAYANIALQNNIDSLKSCDPNNIPQKLDYYLGLFDEWIDRLS